jgi:hypothetical protein
MRRHIVVCDGCGHEVKWDNQNPSHRVVFSVQSHQEVEKDFCVVCYERAKVLIEQVNKARPTASEEQQSDEPVDTVEEPCCSGYPHK